MFSYTRRFFIKLSIKLTLGCLAVLYSSKVLAIWQAKHFNQGELADSLSALFNQRAFIDTDQLILKLPEIAENGANVPITIISDLENIQRVYIFVEKNPTPLAAEFSLSSSVLLYLTARIKMAESCHVWVIAEQGERLLRAKQWVNVVTSGCGTG